MDCHLSTPIFIIAEHFTSSGYEYHCPDAHTLALWCTGDEGEYQVTITHCPLFDSVHVQLSFALVLPVSPSLISFPFASIEQLQTACDIVADTVDYGTVSVQPHGEIIWRHTIPVATVMMGHIDDVLARALTECDNLYPLWHSVNAGQVDMGKLAQVVRQGVLLDT